MTTDTRSLPKKILSYPNALLMMNIELWRVLSQFSKVHIASICHFLGHEVNTDQSREALAREAASLILSNPESIVSKLNEEELLCVRFWAKYRALPMFVMSRPVPLLLQQLGLVYAHKSHNSGRFWTLYMPRCVSEALAPYYQPYLERATQANSELDEAKVKAELYALIAQKQTLNDRVEVVGAKVEAIVSKRESGADDADNDSEAVATELENLKRETSLLDEQIQAYLDKFRAAQKRALYIKMIEESEMRITKATYDTMVEFNAAIAKT